MREVISPIYETLSNFQGQIQTYFDREYGVYVPIPTKVMVPTRIRKRPGTETEGRTLNPTHSHASDETKQTALTWMYIFRAVSQVGFIMQIHHH